MQSLDEFNAERVKLWDMLNSNEPKPNGIGCPACGGELVDTKPNVTLTSFPARKEVSCPTCGYSGYRLA